MGNRTGTSPVGEQLRAWRLARSRTQLDLAIAAGTTARHVSFIETGRARPGAELLSRLADELELPGGAVDNLFRSAGLPSRVVGDTGGDRELATTVEATLGGHEPFPACAMDQQRCVRFANRAYLRLVPDALDLTAEQHVERFFGAIGRAWIVNWAEVAWREADGRMNDAQRAADPEALRLGLRALALLADVPRPDQSGAAGGITILRVGQTASIRLRTVVLHPEQVTSTGYGDLRVELTLPADESARRWLADRSVLES